MIQNIQKNILFKYPLVWNTKLIPMLGMGIAFHVLYFVLGYYDGTIDFSNNNNIDIQVTAVLFGILFVLITTILWLIHYFKNNALKAYYTKSKYSLFYEWLQIFIICFLLISFYISFQIGKQWHQKSYYSFEETKSRCKIISLADVFIDGYFKRTEIDSLASKIVDSNGVLQKNNFEFETSGDIDVNYESNQANGFVYKNYIVFKNKKYKEFSLVNRSIYDFSIFDSLQNLSNQLEVKNWLHQNKQHEVKKLMANYLKLINEHKLATNLNLQNWFTNTYNYPNFSDFIYITPYLNEFEADYNYKYNSSYQYYKDANKIKYSKYFVQQDVLKEKYELVSNAHTSPLFQFEALLAFLYGALGFSLLIFSFRVTSGKSWLIALISVGILNIIFGIFSAIISSSYVYLFLVLISILCITGYFFAIFFNKKSIQMSRIALNLFLWTFAAVLPILYTMLLEFYDDKSEAIKNKTYKWLDNHVLEMFVSNFIIAIVVLFIMSNVIRIWKGIAEE